MTIPRRPRWCQFSVLAQGEMFLRHGRTRADQGLAEQMRLSGFSLRDAAHPMGILKSSALLAPWREARGAAD